MNPESQENLKRILTLPLHELTENDKRFIHARRGYLTNSQKSDYAEVIEEVNALNASLSDETTEGVEEAPTTEVKLSKKQRKQQQKEQEAQNKSKDVHLNLDKPVKTEKQIAAEKAMAEAKRLQKEAEAERSNSSQPAENTGDAQGADNQLEEDECLDPDCTHENHQ